jgi:hypothetical protein
MITFSLMHTAPFADLTSPALMPAFTALDALTDIDRLLRQEGLPDVAVRSGVRHILDDRLPPLSSPLEWPPAACLIAAMRTPADAAGMIAGHLAWDTGPATALFRRLARAPVEVASPEPWERKLTDDEAADLAASTGTPAWGRDGEMTGPVTVAATSLLLIPDRIPPEAMAAIRGGQAAGDALEPYGMRRVRRRVTPDRSQATVDASAVLVLGDVPVGTASEHVTRAFCDYVAHLG